MELWPVPARSPDLNPVELFWSRLRKRLRAMDLDDLAAGRRPVTKTGLKLRVRALVQTPRAQRVATNCWRTFKKKCAEVVRKRGAAIAQG